MMEINGKIEPFDVVPFDLTRYSEYEKEYFDSFNTALDEFFGKKSLEQVAEVKEAEKRRKTLAFTKGGFSSRKRALQSSKKKSRKITFLQR